VTTICGSVVTPSSPRHPCGQWSRHLIRHDLCTILGDIPWRIQQVHRLCIDLALEKPPGVDMRPALVIRSTSVKTIPLATRDEAMASMALVNRAGGSSAWWSRRRPPATWA